MTRRELFQLLAVAGLAPPLAQAQPESVIAVGPVSVGATPHSILIQPFEVWTAPVGAPWPEITGTAPSPWTLLAASKSEDGRALWAIRPELPDEDDGWE